MVPVRAGRGVVLAFMMVAVALSGCAGDDDGAATATDATTASPGASTGAIEGLVVNEEGLPVGGVDVAIIEDGLQTTTGEKGNFVFNDVAPGTKRIFVQRLGFESVGTTVSVVAGETAQVSITLDAIVVADPWQQTFIGEGFMTCHWSTPVVKSRIPCNGIGDDENVVFDWMVQPGLWETLTETVWEQTTPLSPLYIELDHIFDDDCQECNVIQQSPHVHHSTDYDDDFDEETELTESYWLPFGNTSQPVIVSIQQKFTVYMTAFYHQPLPDGFQARP